MGKSDPQWLLSAAAYLQKGDTAGVQSQQQNSVLKLYRSICCCLVFCNVLHQEKLTCHNQKSVSINTLNQMFQQPETRKQTKSVYIWGFLCLQPSPIHRLSPWLSYHHKIKLVILFSDNVSKSGPDFMLYCICSKFSFQRTTDSQKVAEILEKSHVTLTQFLPVVTSYMNHSTKGNQEIDTVTTHIAYSDFTRFPVCVSIALCNFIVCVYSCSYHRFENII